MRKSVWCLTLCAVLAFAGARQVFAESQPNNARETALTKAREALRASGLPADEYRLEILEDYSEIPTASELMGAGASEDHGALVGRVATAEGQLVAGARVTATLVDKAAPEYVVYTSQDGRFEIANLPYGQYRVTLEGQGYPRLECDERLQGRRRRMLAFLGADAKQGGERHGEAERPTGFMTVAAYGGKEMQVLRVEFTGAQATVHWGVSPREAVMPQEWRAQKGDLGAAVDAILDVGKGPGRLESLIDGRNSYELATGGRRGGGIPSRKELVGMRAQFLDLVAHGAWAQALGVFVEVCGEERVLTGERSMFGEFGILRNDLHLDLQALGVLEPGRAGRLREAVRRWVFAGWAPADAHYGRPALGRLRLPSGDRAYIVVMRLREMEDLLITVADAGGNWRVISVEFPD